MNSEERLLVGYGTNPPKGCWPNGSSLAVSFVINVEEGAERSPLYGDIASEGLGEVPRTLGPGIRDLATESIYEYGSRVGVFRLLHIFDSLELPTTIFAAARALEVNPPLSQTLKGSRHEICAHGYRWAEAWEMDEEEEREAIVLAIESIQETTGRRPVGWYSRWMRSERTRRLLVEIGGFLYDSDAYNDDTPYYVEVLGEHHLVVPYSLTYNDASYFYGHFAAPTDFIDYVSRAADFLLAEGDGSLRILSIGLHPRLSGQAGRASAVKEMAERLLDRQNVWFATREQIARHWYSAFPPPSPSTT